MNDFTKEGGGTIRMLGIMNELSIKGHEVIFISNTMKYDNFASSIKHIFIDFPFSRQDKRIFQGLLGVFPIPIINMKYKALLNRLQNLLGQFRDEYIYFFEYLDNSIGYWLSENKLIKGYINDLHGVATLEFKFQFQQANSVKQKIKFYTKYKISDLLDYKVFSKTSGLIFASKAMQSFYTTQYPVIRKNKSYILPYVLSSNAIDDEVDLALADTIKRKLSILDEDKVILFAGAFKQTGGVPDLINAFKKVASNNNNVRLFLIGDGPTYSECFQFVKNNFLENRVEFIGRIPYNHLRTYQSLATIIVCPDKQNVYSELIIHVKYIDALISEKLVINGSFKSVAEVNPNEKLSINFEPSNVDSLANAMQYCLNNEHKLLEKYKNNKTFVQEQLTYKTVVNVLD